MNPTDPSLSQQVAELAARVSRLEAAAQPEQARAAARPDAEPDALWALTALRSQRADHPATADGIVMIVGSVTLPDGTPVAWQEGAAPLSLFEQDWTDHAAAFAALGHPVRLELVRHIMSGVHATAELADRLTRRDGPAPPPACASSSPPAGFSKRRADPTRFPQPASFRC